jgi:hypothetical protein
MQSLIRFAAVAVGVAIAGAAGAQEKINLSIATGGTGGVYYPLGGGMAAVLSKFVPGMQATAEVTGGSVDNLKLIGSALVGATGRKTRAFDRYLSQALCNWVGHGKASGNKPLLRGVTIRRCCPAFRY